VDKRNTARELFDRGLDWLRANYGNYEFFAERDLVWVLQQKLWEIIDKDNLSLEVYHNFPIAGKQTDLAILNKQNEVELAIEFKYEPDHRRRGFWPTKFPVVFWKEGVGKDIERASQYVKKGKAKLAVTIFVDEGGYFRHRKPYPNTK
jgi:hypothetical protein